MGTWGTGNLDGDNASDFLEALIKQLSKAIREGMSPESLGKYDFLMREGEAKVMPAVDILITLVDYYQTPPQFGRKEVEEWRQKYLENYDREIDSYGPKEEYKTQRRIVILETFNRLEKLVTEWDEL